MNPREDADFDARLFHRRALEKEARQPEPVDTLAPVSEHVGTQAGGIAGLKKKRQQQFFDFEATLECDAVQHRCRRQPDFIEPGRGQSSFVSHIRDHKDNASLRPRWPGRRSSPKGGRPVKWVKFS